VENLVLQGLNLGFLLLINLSISHELKVSIDLVLISSILINAEP
jgi:hypothetical protein